MITDLAMTNRRSFTETVRRMSQMEKVAIVQRGSDELRGVRMAEALVEATEPSEGDLATNLADLSLADTYHHDGHTVSLLALVCA